MVSSREGSLSIPAVWTAVDTVSRVIASLPIGLYEKTKKGRRHLGADPLDYLVSSEPDEYMTGFNWRRGFFAQACFRDAFARIYRNGHGDVVRLKLLDSTCMDVQRNMKGEVIYRYCDSHTGEIATLFPFEVLHVKGLTLDGIVGQDVISRHRNTFGIAAAADEYGNSFFGNFAGIPGYLKSKTAIPPTERDLIESNFNRKFAGARKAGKAPLLDADMDYIPTGVGPDKAMLNEVRSFQVRQVARIFGVPLHLFADLGDTTFNNVEMMSTNFVTIVLRPWAVQFEQELRLKLLSKADRVAGKKFFYLNLTDLLRGDTKTRALLYQTMFNTGSLSPNEIRAMENLNHREGGDEYFLQLNLSGSQGTNDKSENL